MSKMKDAFHEQFGGSPKHDAVPELFEAGWNAVIEACGGHDHLLSLHEHDWTLQHPITERLEGTLFECELHRLIEVMVFHERFPGPGLYRFWRTPSVVPDTTEWNWEPTDAR